MVAWTKCELTGTWNSNNNNDNDTDLILFFQRDLVRLITRP